MGADDRSAIQQVSCQNSTCRCVTNAELVGYFEGWVDDRSQITNSERSSSVPRHRGSFAFIGHSVAVYLRAVCFRIFRGTSYTPRGGRNGLSRVTTNHTGADGKSLYLHFTILYEASSFACVSGLRGTSGNVPNGVLRVSLENRIVQRRHTMGTLHFKRHIQLR